MTNTPNFALWISDLTSKLGFFPDFCACNNRTSQVFPLIWWTWPDLAPNFASKLDVRSPPPRPPNMEVPLWDFKVSFLWWECQVICSVFTWSDFQNLQRIFNLAPKRSQDIMQNLSAPFIFQEECRMKIERVPFAPIFSKLRIRVSESHFHCVHKIRFWEPTKIESLKTDRLNGP